MRQDDSKSGSEGTKSVVIYSSPTCGYCKMAKEFFEANDVAYEDKNVIEDADARKKMIDRSGQMGTPVIFVGDEMVIGFDEGKLKELLGV